ncbi:AAA family ATPase [Chloroflexota bacterium]
MRPRNFEDILSRLSGAKQSGDHWIAPCPLSGHNTPAGHLTLKDAGDKALITCQGGRHNYHDYCEAWGYDSLTYSSNDDGAEAKIIATYDYTDVDGNLLYQVVRYDPKKFKQRRPDSSGGWEWDLKGIKPVLYRLSEVLRTISEGRTVYICEGEKDANNLTKLGLTVTTNSGGAEKWRSEYSETLQGATVVVLPDKDASGQRHAVKVATALYGKTKSIKVVRLPDRDDHQIKDVSDWLAAGGTVGELEALTVKAPEYTPKEIDISLVCIADVEPETVSWLWLPYIPRGKLTLLEGDPGVGKSWVSLAIATAVSLGRGLPGTEAIESERVVLASAEDGLGDTIRPRLDAMGADVRQIQAIKDILDFGNGGLGILEGHIKDVNPAVVIVDPLVAYIGAGVDLHRANETRAVMAKLADIAEKHGCAILAVRHLTKGGTLKPIYRGLGSIDLTAACRSVLMAGCDPENEAKRGLVHIKSNLAPKGQAIGYELRDGRFYWTGESDLTAARILAAEDSEGKSAIDEAADFLRDELADGPVEAKQVFSDAKSSGIYERTLNRAKSRLRITSRREGESGKRGIARVKWQLPEDLKSQKDLGCQDCLIEDTGNVNQISYNNPVDSLGVGNVNIPDLGMPVEKAIDVWRSEGAPLIHLGPGENCEKLDLLLSNPNNKAEHLLVVKAWLDKVIKRRGEG